MYLALAFTSLCMLSKIYDNIFKVWMYGVFEFTKNNFCYFFVLLRKGFQNAGKLSKGFRREKLFLRRGEH